MRGENHLTHLRTQPEHLQRRCEHSAIKETEPNEESAAEIMRGAESSCGLPIFCRSRSSRRVRSRSSRASWNCSKKRSLNSSGAYFFRDDSSICVRGVTGTSCGCSDCVECTCSCSGARIRCQDDHSGVDRRSCGR